MLLTGIIIPTIFCNISKAADVSTWVCSTCNGTPSTISQINTMTRELLFEIQTIWTQAPYAGKSVSPVRFEDGYFNPPKTNILSKTLTRAREWLGSLLAIGRIFVNLNENGVTQFLDSKAILVKGKIYKRDWAKLEDVQQEIVNKKFALSVGGWRDSVVKSKTLRKMQATIQTYKDAGILDNQSEIAEWTTYSDILKLVDDLNVRTKNQIVSPSSDKLKEDITKGTSLIKISSSAVDGITAAYKCVSEQSCDNSRSQVKIDLKSISDLAKSGFASSLQEITQANERLAAVGKNIFQKKISNPEDQALKNRFGLTTKQIENAGFLGFNSDRRRSQRQTVKEWFTSMFSNGEKESKDIVLPAINNPQEKSFKLTMLTSINDILQEADQEKDYVMMAQNNDVLTRFTDLSTKLTTLNQIIGEKSKDNSLIKNLWEVCTNQCSNITSKKCYY